MIREYIRRSHAPEHIGWQVAVNHRLNATRNPYAHIHKPDITIEEVRNSPMLWDPIRFLESCPSSDGSCAVVISSEMHARLAPRPPAWIHGTGWRTETGHFAGRDEVNPRAGQECAAAAYREAGITDPGTEVDVSELYIPYSWYEPMWMENIGLAPESSGWRAVDEGHTAFGAGTRSTRPEACSPAIRPVPPAYSDSPRPPCRCGGSRVNTRSMEPDVR